jgi:hypothetical protein
LWRIVVIVTLINLAESGGIWEAVIKVATPLNLAAFALAVVLFIALKSRGRKVSPAIWVVIVALVAIPIGASVYSEIIAKTSIYRLRVTVVNQQGMPINEAEEGVRVWSSFGGEPKRVAGGWEFDIPSASKPIDGKLTIYASKENAFLTGSADLILGKDYNPTAIVNLKRNDSAKVRGQVVDVRHRAVAGARVLVVGYESEAVITQEGGAFELPAHAATGQTVLLYAGKNGYRPAKQPHPAGDMPAELILER